MVTVFAFEIPEQYVLQFILFLQKNGDKCSDCIKSCLFLQKANHFYDQNMSSINVQEFSVLCDKYKKWNTFITFITILQNTIALNLYSTFFLL